MTSLFDFYRMLGNHDWTHMMSDDPRVERRGAESLSNLRRIAKESEEHKKLFDEYEAYAWGRGKEKPKAPPAPDNGMVK
jgi:hypothetical protein